MSEQEGRLYIYRLLKIIFEQPLNKENLTLLRKDSGLSHLAQISLGARTIWDYLEKNKDKDPEELCKELQVEYLRLFVGPGSVLVPIWESVYFDPERLMFGDRTFEARECYRKYNLQYVHKNRRPEDHLAVELEFMLFLVQKYLTCQDNDQQKELLSDQKDFLVRHLATWKDEFLQLLLKSTHCQLYKGGGLLLKEFIEVELNMFEDLKEVG